ncbi:U2 snRNP complex subunit [Orbilia oligospora]|uniref:U2 small nuclear ribonucleoprotein A' n=1 Tax=Orbilia oligospora TaxID=2813651 RepID=A0A6G1MIT7_ORBOL|nr:U2 snRNP complex subunit [Orbilia oligospora]KAF3207371.1 U2 snRNP complex subunit [Orbilia oligospora]KAF3224229.1 U2 snRNP complex subunit [Orbilia oligospora]KAF3230451.1 U2 snRNP complex subunit [Orbilia oligospora]KAF3260433.1 U2 snRNP complex subunit [Orbilia oligospora]
MRLSAELLADSPSYLNPLKERELDLRGHKIPIIENLGVAKDQDAIDFTDNDIQQLGNFPLSPRLKTLLLARNRISSIQSTLASSVPNLYCVALQNNSLSELVDLVPLGKLKQLVHLVLLDNPVVRKDNYRLWVVWTCPTVRYLDYERVKDAERKEAEKLFGTEEEPSPTAAKILGVKSRHFDVSSGDSRGEKNFKTTYTQSEKLHIQDMIRNAKSLEEVARLEKQLRDGTLVLASADDVEMKG